MTGEARGKYEYEFVYFNEQSPYTCKRTNVKQVVNMNIHSIKDK